MSSFRKSVVITFTAMFALAAPANRSYAQCCGVFGGLNAASGATLISQQGQALALNLAQGTPTPQSIALFNSLFTSRTDVVFVSNVEFVVNWTPSLTGFLSLPLVYKSGNFRIPSALHTVDAFGVGDVLAGVEYSLMGGPARQKILGGTEGTFQLSLLGGLEFPTGESRAQAGGDAIPLNLQLGVGSVNPLMGATIGWREENWIVSGSALYKTYGEARGFQPGDIWSLQAAGDRMVFAHQSGGLRVPQLWVGLGITGFRAGSARLADEPVANSNGYAAFLVPRAQLYVTRRLSIDFSYSYPVGADFGATETSFPGISSLTLRWIY